MSFRTNESFLSVFAEVIVVEVMRLFNQDEVMIKLARFGRRTALVSVSRHGYGIFSMRHTRSFFL